MNAKIIEIKKYFQRKQIIINAEKSCTNCDHYFLLKKEKPSCGHYPIASLHSVNIECCQPNKRLLWKQKRGIISRFLDWFF